MATVTRASRTFNAAAIFGVIGPHVPEDAEAMADRLKHRGRCCHIERMDGISFGAVGDEPQRMLYRSGTELVVAAGVIYGLGEEALCCDPQQEIPELLHRHIETAGMGKLETINGDFAAVVCQRKGGRVLLLRDYFGCMPLYWSLLANGCLAFASEYKAIVTLHSFAPVIDRDVLQYLQATKRIPVGRTLLANVAAAKPGLTVIENQNVMAHHDFSPLVCDVRIRDEETARKVVREQFREALIRRSSGQDPLGLALSGGVDSIAMAFQLRDLFPELEIHTFTAGYGETDPEMRTAEEAASQIGAIHHPVITPPDLLLTSFNKLIWHLEDPCSRSEALQLLRVAEVAAPFVGRILSGQGADGLFAGMQRHKLLHMVEKWAPIRGALLQILDLTQLGIPPKSLLGRAFAAALYRGKVPPVPVVIGGAMTARQEPLPSGPQFVNRVLAAGYRNSASQDVSKFERTFGASGIGYSSPCLDVPFAQLAFTIDENLKIRNGFQKYIFRRALSQEVPRHFRALPKHPQRMTYDAAFADCLDELADDLLSPSSVRSRGFFEPSSIERIRLRKPGRPYAAEAAMRLWTAMGTELWARLFLDGHDGAVRHQDS